MSTIEESPEELSDHDYLRDLSDRLMAVPAIYGTDQYDCDRLLEISRTMKEKPQDAIVKAEGESHA